MSDLKFKKTIHLGYFNSAEIQGKQSVRVVVSVYQSKHVKFIGYISSGASQTCISFGQVQNTISSNFYSDKHKELIDFWNKLHMEVITSEQFISLKSFLEHNWRAAA